MSLMANLEATSHSQAEQGASRAPVAALLWAGAGLSLLAAGILLWSTQGADIFTAMLSAASAWCF
jgi:hypothetical protein